MVEWEGELFPLSADDMLKGTLGRPSKQGRAADVLRELLVSGPAPVKELQAGVRRTRNIVVDRQSREGRCAGPIIPERKELVLGAGMSGNDALPRMKMSDGQNG